MICHGLDQNTCVNNMANKKDGDSTNKKVLAQAKVQTPKAKETVILQSPSSKKHYCHREIDRTFNKELSDKGQTICGRKGHDVLMHYQKMPAFCLIIYDATDILDFCKRCLTCCVTCVSQLLQNPRQSK